ncbi:MAG: zinc-ribbon domain-containing protein [Chloroflexi bacterium]|nr:zinc-ribbon domain-containing protein [Chloroflexota bacterium]
MPSLTNYWQKEGKPMAIGSILLGTALLVLVGLFLARPFLRPQEEEVALTEQQQLLEEKEALLDQIQALDFDHETGKIPTELHAHQRAYLVEQATAVMQAIDGMGTVITPDAIDVDIEMEAAIARLRQHREASSVSVGNGQARFCPQCGSGTDSDDKFCTHCGHNLALTTL